jgi:hypothetical protein
MRPIRRAAVTGLFALWLAPLPALAGSQAADTPSGRSEGSRRVAERSVSEDAELRAERRWGADQARPDR